MSDLNVTKTLGSTLLGEDTLSEVVTKASSVVLMGESGSDLVISKTLMIALLVSPVADTQIFFI